MRFGHYTVFDTPEENKHTQVYVEYDVPNNDDLEGATGTIVLTEGGQGSGGGGGDAGNGIRSITISPAIETTPPFDSISPIYFGDTYEPFIHLTPNGDLPASAEITITPTDGWYAYNGETFGAAGEPVTISVENDDDSLYCRITVTNDIESAEPEEFIGFDLAIEE